MYFLNAIIIASPDESKVDVISFDPWYWSYQSTATFSMDIMAQWISSHVYYNLLICFYFLQVTEKTKYIMLSFLVYGAEA